MKPKLSEIVYVVDKIVLFGETKILLVKHKMITKLTLQHKLPMKIENMGFWYLLLLHLQFIYNTNHEKHIFIPCVYMKINSNSGTFHFHI